MTVIVARMDACGRAAKILESNGAGVTFNLVSWRAQPWPSLPSNYSNYIGMFIHLLTCHILVRSKLSACDNDKHVQQGLLRDPFFAGHCIFADAPGCNSTPYPYSLNHGSEKLVPSIAVTFQMRSCLTSMIWEKGVSCSEPAAHP